MKKQLHKLLNNKLEAINNIKHINRGGCAIVALNLYEYLKSQGLKPTIIYLSSKYDHTSVSNIQNKVPEACVHCYIKVGNYYVDSEGIRDLHKFKAETMWWAKHHIVTPSYIAKTITTRNLWNPQYDRRSNRSIKAILNES